MGIPFQRDVVEDVLQRMRISKVGDATIRQTVALSEELERRTGEKFIHLEMGSPGLPASRFGIEAQKEALDNGVASSYPNISGIAPLKEQASRFVKAFLDIDVKPEGCIPTVGSMMGTFASFIVCTHLSSKKTRYCLLIPVSPYNLCRQKCWGINGKHLMYTTVGESACVISWRAFWQKVTLQALSIPTRTILPGFA